MEIYFTSSLVWIPVATVVIFILVGQMTKKFPPEEINGLNGYRSARSMRSQQAWDFAQKKEPFR
ncbi:hypothetical protein Aconfl_28910 [Algoriphagus confluentis]|uniref:SdpI family protein n=1 Tax=Algoriphagus confluentis TaxID=1697556 RepID=A0ABQ6PSU2_9BACT|nr:hypothetical protein Aconfl_28910 [Algoriphagus confluentis]